MEYIAESGSKQGCFFCEALRGNDDRANLVLARRDRAFVVMNRYPYANGHLMIVPNSHTGELERLCPEEYLDLNALVTLSVGILKRAVSAQGFNIGINLGAVAGAGVVDHVHIHIVPRWLGDTNYMPVFGETKVIGEHILETYDKLKPYYAK